MRFSRAFGDTELSRSAVIEAVLAPDLKGIRATLAGRASDTSHRVWRNHLPFHLAVVIVGELAIAAVLIYAAFLRDP